MASSFAEICQEIEESNPWSKRKAEVSWLTMQQKHPIMSPESKWYMGGYACGWFNQPRQFNDNTTDRRVIDAWYMGYDDARGDREADE